VPGVPWFLYFRLKGLVLRLPALRERPDDIDLLAARFLADSAGEAGRSGVTLSGEAVRALQRLRAVLLTGEQARLLQAKDKDAGLLVERLGQRCAF